MEILKVDNVTFRYPDMEKNVLQPISFSIERGSFVVLCGASGSGKTTLLRLLKHELAPYGKQTGTIYYNGKSLDEWDARLLTTEFGFVFQDPDNQIVMDEVLQEIVFGMENMNIPYIEMKKRLSELVHFFGVEDLLYKQTSTLSGGQKQLINLLSILLLRPKVLLLDEPTSQLDPIAAKELLQILERLNNEMGMTIIIVEHRLEDLFSMADKVIMLEEGNIAYEGKSRDVIKQIYENNDRSFLPYLPSVSRLFLAIEEKDSQKVPLNVKETRTWLHNRASKMTNHFQEILPFERKAETILKIENIYFQYEKTLPLVLKNCNLQIQKGEFFALVGGNGTGKSTLLQIAMGILKQQRGNVILREKKLKKYSLDELAHTFAYLPQHPLAFYIEETIGKEMERIIHQHQIEDGKERMAKIAKKLNVDHLFDRHPNDLSGGELQRATLACLLLSEPEVLFIDEPTKGLDPISKEALAKLLLPLQKDGLTIFMVTHDIEFAVQYVDYCAILFDGQIAVEGTPEQLFKSNYFYTTSINRATTSVNGPEILTLEEALKRWR
ncbi:ABC transporter ATP-binding protein [Pseudogracilibacillus sp. ICA-222130]|uniref:ABC transporter ATP-binding protein n=1 Tax=Pseudogracilibacillus sp. ICA-222130 TaxID=3134655 RepID=UPI0030BC103A